MNRDELLQLLVCPVCHGKLSALPAAGPTEGLLCDKCAVVYPVREDIPVMLPEEAVARAAWEEGKREAAPCA